MVNVWLFLKYRFIRVQNYSCGTKILKLDQCYLELHDGSKNFVNNVYSHFVKIIWIFFVIGSWTQKIYSHCNFYNFLTKFRYYCNYYVLILRCKVELYLENNWIIHIYIYDKWFIMKLMSQNIFLYNFLNLISGTCSLILNYFWYACENSFNM
jgi:hypothetical protein